MIKEIEKAKEGYEKIVSVFDEVIGSIETAKAEEKAEIQAKYEAELNSLDNKYDERLASYKADRANYIETELIEVPDEVLEEEHIVAEDTATDAESEYNNYAGV